MNSIVLSGTRTLVPSRTRSTCYRGRKSELTLCCAKIFRARNFTNLESFGFLLTDLRLLTAVDVPCSADRCRVSELCAERANSVHELRAES